MEIHKKSVKFEDFVAIFTDTMIGLQTQLECNCKKEQRHFLIKLIRYLENKKSDTRDRHTNTTRVSLKKEEEP